MNATALASSVCLLAAVLVSGCTSKSVKPEPMVVREPMPASLPYTEKLSADGLFAFGKSSLDGLSDQGRAELDALAQKVNNGGPIDVVHVIGHSDRIGNDKANAALSLKRAESVRNYLIQRGVPDDKITAVGRGSVEPVVQCGNERKKQAMIDCFAPNRRVEIRVVPAG